MDVHISRLRRCFRPFSRADMIRTVRLGGYALEDCRRPGAKEMTEAVVPPIS
ncbi:helix-turn-helix domain-containing protein [Mesorhizobium sp. 43Arga]